MWGLANLLSARKTSTIRERERLNQLQYEIKLTQLEGRGGIVGGFGGAGCADSARGLNCEEGGTDEDDDQAWKLTAQEVISEETQDDGKGREGDECLEGGRQRVGRVGVDDVSIEALLKTFVVHDHEDIVVSARRASTAGGIAHVYYARGGEMQMRCCYAFQGGFVA